MPTAATTSPRMTWMQWNARLPLTLCILFGCTRTATESPSVDPSSEASTASSAANDVADPSPPSGVVVADAVAAAAVAPIADAAVAAAPITDAQLDIEYGECFGDCKPYALRLRADGTFGGAGARKKVDPDTAQAILRLADSAFSNPLQRCRGPTDTQYVTVTFRRAESVRSSKYPVSHPCSSKLAQVERRMNALAGR